MAEAMLTKRFPLAGIMVPGRHGKLMGEAGVTIRVVDAIAVANVGARKGQNAALLQVLARMFGAPVADQPQRVARDTLSITGISPGQWRLVVRGHDSEATLRTAIAELQESAVVTELGDGLFLADISGPRARAALAKGIAIDLHPGAFKVGAAAQTSASHIGLHLALIDDKPTFEMISAANTAGSLWSWLTSSCGEYGYDISV